MHYLFSIVVTIFRNPETTYLPQLQVFGLRRRSVANVCHEFVGCMYSRHILLHIFHFALNLLWKRLETFAKYLRQYFFLSSSV